MIGKETAEHYIWGENCDGWHLVRDANLSVIYERMPPETAEKRHYHRLARQFFFVLKGTATIEIAGRCEELKSYEGVEVAPGEPHRIFNESAADIEFLVISQPRTTGDRFPAETNNF